MSVNGRAEERSVSKKKVSGWYELVGDPQAGKTTLAALLAREIGYTLWLTTAQELSEPILQRVNPSCDVYLVEKVGEAFGIAREAQGDVDFVVVDSLASLRPDHPGARNVAGDVTCLLFTPTVPILVVNQDRHPAPPGGARWVAVASRRRLTLYRQQPFLASYLDDGRWLTWWGSPKLGGLTEREKLFVGEEVMYEVFRVSQGQKRPWL